MLLKSFSANLEFSSILAEKQNLFGLTERGGIIRLKEWSRETSFLSQWTSSLYHPWSPADPCLEALCNLRFLFELKAPAYLLRTVGVTTLMFISSFGRLCRDLLEKLFEFVFRMDSGPFICRSTESDMTSIISDSANPASFKTSTLSRKLAISCFEIKSFSSGLVLIRKTKKRV